MFRLSLRTCFSRRVLVSIANRYSKGFQHRNIKNECIGSEQISEQISENNVKLVKNTNVEELYDLSPPKPFDEVQVTEGKEDFHPADFIDNIGPPLPISFNLAAYVNHSETLQKLVQLGVDLSEIDKSPKKAKYILKLDFEKDVKDHIQFLHDHGVDSDELGHFITKNPFIFQEELENLEIRINYLKSKKFSTDAIAQIITRNPYFLSKSTKSVDACLGFFQKQFYLTGDEVRHVITRGPKLVSYDPKKFQEKMFIIKEACGFTKEEAKQLLISKPKIWMLGARVFKERFDIVHNAMKISHQRIVEFPGVFLKRTFLLRERHEYLVHLNRAQYDPTKPNFVSLEDIATTTDQVFCEMCAKTSIDKYNEFLKTR